MVGNRGWALRQMDGAEAGWRARRPGERSGPVRPAFTLIELLVVIAVLTILAGILFPVFAQVRERARQATCLSNLRQISTGMHLYEQDYDERFPPVVSRGPDEHQYFAISWMHLLEPYVKDTRVFLDPSTGKSNIDWRASSDLLESYGYAPSTRVWGGPGGAEREIPPQGAALWEGIGGFAGIPIGWFSEVVPSYSANEVVRPAETVLVCDHYFFDWGLSIQQDVWPATRHMREADIQLPNGDTVSEGLINCVFVDGHVRALKHTQLWEVLPGATRRFGEPQSVFRHFWPHD